ncbi:host attachment protein [Parasphingorhabdus sp. JC815]|uniref:host attachment protein n=1 Tax=Parasphingorhabdus sp. JC815 TaxID=3232140 RepID=UPI003457AD15
MLVENGSFILALNGARMALYQNLGKALHVDLELLEQDQNLVPEMAELGRDRPGRTFYSKSSKRSGYEATDLQSQEEERFIKQSISRLEELAVKAQKPAIILAPPEALGFARKYYSPALRKLIDEEIYRDYATKPASEISAFLAEY